ncbi:MAG: CHAT domain-containing protein [Candidatus Eisenbacteria bacterium]
MSAWRAPWVVALALAMRITPVAADPVADSAAVLRDRIRVDAPGAVTRARAWRAALDATQASDTARAVATDVLVEAMLENGEWGDDAVALAERAVRAQAAAHGDSSAETGSSLVTLGRLRYRREELPAALSATAAGLAICQRAPGSNRRGVYRGLRYLANIEDEMADFGPAERDYRSSVALADSLFGPDGVDYSNALNSFGSFCRRTGRVTEARDLYERSIAIRERASGPDDPGLMFPLNNLGNLLTEIGDPAAARALFERDLAIVTRAFGPTHPNVPFLLNNLSDAELALGDTARAVTDMRRAIAVADSSGGSGRADIAQVHNNLGQVEIARGDTAAARAEIERGLAIRVGIYGRDHPEVARSLERLGDLAIAEGDAATAAMCDSEALAILERHLGPDAIDLAEPLVALGGARRWLGADREALDDAARAERIATDHVRLVMRSLEERVALRFALTRPRGLDLALTLAADHPTDDGIARRVWDLVVRSRALVLDEMARRHHAVLASPDPATRALADSLAAVGETLARLLAGGSAPTAVPVQARVRSLRVERERLEHRLAARSARFRSDARRETAGLDAVTAALDPDVALVAFARFDRLPARPSTGSQPSYLAFVTNGGHRAPAVMPLGDAVSLERAADRWLGELERRPAVLDAAAGQRCHALGAQVRVRVWDPLRSRAGDARVVLVVPDGALQRVPFAALPVHGGFLVERGPATQVLSAERDLVTDAAPPAAGRGLLAVGGPAFDAMPAHPVGDGHDRGAGSACEAFRSLRFESLPGARREAETVAAAWRRAAPDSDTRMLLGGDARERAVRTAMAGRRAIHLATHGFFLGATCVVHDQLDSLALEDPLLRTGIALAGANQRADASHGDDDGILTAAEIATLDLEGVECVTLSACQGARGEIQDGEGVLGLRRGFSIAGARTLISSLWPIDDRATEQWMETWYDARLNHGRGVAEATRDAQRAVLAARRAAGDGDHPYFWAAFQAAGEWR